MLSNQGQQYVGRHKSGRLLESDSQLGRSGPWVPPGPCVLRIDVKNHAGSTRWLQRENHDLKGIDDGARGKMLHLTLPCSVAVSCEFGLGTDRWCCLALLPAMTCQAQGLAAAF